ncbi:hypothetical protein CDL15_Pgr003866 [Punica granatum]|uniref:Uncharacterized protein n=1 Tax=Punica granatum TaxID=22663 RepID=A0A218XU34_PUNGR|nr:hypothetical protein CDL15_Pgr003866 [Punica granatum]
MVLGGSTFLAGAAINSGAQNIAMLILGRILLGHKAMGSNQTSNAIQLYTCALALHGDSATYYADRGMKTRPTEAGTELILSLAS